MLSVGLASDDFLQVVCCLACMYGPCVDYSTPVATVATFSVVSPVYNLKMLLKSSLGSYRSCTWCDVCFVARPFWGEFVLDSLLQ